MSPRYSPAELACTLGLFPPTDEQAAVIAAPPGPLVVIAGAGAGKTETMAARVVWLVANGYAEPSQVLGLTFTRKAASQLLRRVRSRLARLAGIGPGSPASGWGYLPLVGAYSQASPAVPAAVGPVVSTYHAFAGSLLRDYGLLLPVEPDTRLLSETELWQLAFDVVNGYRGELNTDKTPATVTSMVLRLWGQLAEHLVDTQQLRDTHVELERLVHTLPAGPYQRDRGPSQWLLRMLATQTERAALVPLLDALAERMRAAKVMDFGVQMACAARLAATFPQVGQDLRSRYRVVLLDEYQDTGHAQRVALSGLFGGGGNDGDDELALTAVGDPIQSIYGWRGASATNLPRFTTDFPRSDGSPAPVLELRTSWRNPPRALHVANAISAEARRRSVAVRALRSRPDAPSGAVRAALLPDVRAEREWITDHISAHYQRAEADGVDPPTAAVLVRRNADAAPIADALRARGIPVEVVGLAGLLSIPEVADVVAMLRLVADPTAGAAALRVLTGPRWRLGGRDVAALWRRALALGGGRCGEARSPESIAMAAGPDADTACLADALGDPGPASSYSVVGYQRICALAVELTALRGQLCHSLPDLVAEVRRVLGVDCEVRAASTASPAQLPGAWAGAEHLDVFADVVAGYAERASATTSETTVSAAASVAGLLAYLDVAEVVEKGLPPAQLVVARDRVQVLTVHAAKGLEWQVVAVAHLAGGVFPSTASKATWLTDAAELPPLLRGDRSSAGTLGIPVLDTSDVTNRKQLSDKISTHRHQLEQRRVDEERRLLYVGITRAEDTLLVSGHHWGSTGIKPRGPSDFLCELKDIIDRSAAAGDPCGVVEQWAPAPADGEQNPLRDNVVEAVWPADPLAGRRGDVEHGAALVVAAMSDDMAHPGTDIEGWAADVDALLAERSRAGRRLARTLPSQVSVTGLVDLARDPTGAARRLIHRLPTRPDPHALLGNAFHAWVQRFYGAERLFDLADLPGAADSDVGDTQELAALQAAFGRSQWATRTPVAVEVPFEMPIGDTVLRGRIDAVFGDPDGGITVVDWKTGEPPRGPKAMRQAAVQLAVYRLAWAALCGCPESSVRAAFYYVRSGVTVIPDELPDATELAGLLGDPAGSCAADV
ncbi:ATP-dependent helicase [Mycobacterium haemophilum]|uniref:DNA 3'-5' helicase n=1 Tax=Mycobacterium haemophilum TaxID=29311 RepID=A0A0I9UC86_9MYCO|nr:ATP-dependent DNA helicase [Mycobacterium haemophilum]AKN17894.1 ATP-dependent DNA helicase [Mycobacterium haemophilum DSM 44634]KLO33546.1 ATP-dependent DNA helicase [Mycobacterium haemophilum]KLO39073.1 ATP-dependent DNA helicase [Mycobacterium haemophilum]KLO45487.1 ATP-dependent DNA helicase [Mycobacterium haemophilum]KLO56639.1 ATP-dependent DNA helicase [Mycobacterium haemophilum]